MGQGRGKAVRKLDRHEAVPVNISSSKDLDVHMTQDSFDAQSSICSNYFKQSKIAAAPNRSIAY